MTTLQSFVDRIENLDAEQKGIGTDKRDVFDEAAESGFDKKAIRRLLRDRREAAKDKGTAELAEQYKMLLSEPGATYRSVAEKTGVPLGTLHRRVSVPRTEKRNAYIDKITETTGPDTPLCEGAGTTDKPDGPGSVLAINSETGSATRSGDGLCDALSPDAGPCKSDACSTDEPSLQHEIGAVAASEPRVATDEIDLTPPSRLLAKRREIEERRRAS